MDNNPDWLETITESDSDLKQDISMKGRLCELSACILAASEALSKTRMLFSVSNALPGSDI